ncbi:hypothetical protein NDU88_003473 [Pleurodeles waltl]|uniref:Uncharacterized protein n=1 Tax=Pleurodeles waltl TaxID=8319 RepID=A0AAV7MDX6_PLEWA|nr:hypothetical protein NDU88_003473 [Pleurodeles waltl]
MRTTPEKQDKDGPDEEEEEGLVSGPDLQSSEAEDNLLTGVESPARAGSSVVSHNLSPAELVDRKVEREFKLHLAKLQMEEAATNREAAKEEAASKMAWRE